MSAPPEFMEELRHRLHLSQVVGRRVKLVKKGREYTGLCPFHHEKSPSFFVNDDKAFYHCFGCGAHGDVIEFVMRCEGLSFPETLERLAGEAGLALPKASPQAAEESKKRKTLEDVNEAACLYFESQLRLPAGREALDYLRRRGVSEEEIGRHRLGYAPDQRDGLLKALERQGFPLALAVEAGALIQTEEKPQPFDRFRGRVMFPIQDRRGRVVGFGGRVMGDGQPKYLNTPETPLFHKGKLLYGGHLAREAASRGAPVLAAEGYLDVIALRRMGFPGAVAPLGTALTDEHLTELWRMAPEPFLCFDGDKAGRRAMGRAAEKALPHLGPGRSLRFVALPDGQDPDDLARRPDGPARMAQAIAGAEALVDALWRLELEAGPADTPERRADLRRRLRAHAQAITDQEVRALYRDAFAEKEAVMFGRASSAPEVERGRGEGARGGPGARGAWSGAGRSAGGHPWRGRGGPPPRDPYLAKPLNPMADPRRQAGAALLAAVIHHPEVGAQLLEELAAATLPDPHLDALRARLVDLLAAEPGASPRQLRARLAESEAGEALPAIDAPAIRVIFPAARPDGAPEAAAAFARELLGRLSLADGRAGVSAEAEALRGGDLTPEAVARLRAAAALRVQDKDDPLDG